MNKVVVFDLDHTLVHGDTSTMWGEYALKHGIIKDKDYLKKERDLMALYAQGKMKVEDYIAFSSGALSHLTIDEISNDMKKYVLEVVKERFFKEGQELIASFKKSLDIVIIISASASYIVHEVASYLNVDKVIAVDVKVADNKLTGIIEGTAPFREGKVFALEHYLKEHNLTDKEIWFYTDSINDLPLCKYAHKAFAVNPDSLLLAQAKDLGFEVLSWQNEGL